MIFVNWWMFIITLALKGFTSSLAVLPHTHCLCIGEILPFIHRFWNSRFKWRAPPKAAVWLLLQMVHFHIDFGQVPEKFVLLHFGHSLSFSLQFYCMCNIYELVYPDYYNLLRLFFWLLTINPPLNNSDLSEFLTNEKVTKVIAVPSGWVHLFKFLAGISQYMNASSMS